MGPIVIRDLQGHLSNLDGNRVYIGLDSADKTPLVVRKIPKTKTFNPLTAIKWKFTGRPIPEGCVKIKIGRKSALVDIQELAAASGLTPEALLDPEKGQTAGEALTFSVRRLNQALEKLDALNLDGLTAATPTGPKRLSGKEVMLIKQVVRSALIAQLMHPRQKKGSVESKLFVTKDIQLIARSEGEALMITGLFGKVIGKGAHGACIQTVDLLKGCPLKEGMAVVKVALSADREELGSLSQEERADCRIEEVDDLLQEVYISNLLHKDGEVLGLGKPLRGYESNFIESKQRGNTIESSEKTDTVHFGPLYAGGELFDRTKERTLHSLQERLWISYQIAHGVAHMHRQHVTHGDIKLSNVFMGNESDAYLSDFAGSINHNEPDPFGRHYTYTPQLCCESDEEKLSFLDVMGGPQKRKLFEQMDVFATSLVFYQVFTNGEDPFHGQRPYSKGPSDLSEDFTRRLQGLSSILSQNTIQLIVLGLSNKASRRPSIEELRRALETDLQRSSFPQYHRPNRRHRLNASIIS